MGGLLESKIRGGAGFQRASHSSAGIPKAIGCRFRTPRSQARRQVGAALRLDNPFPLVSLSEVEKRSWVHVERVEIATGEIVRIEAWVFAETSAPIDRVRTSPRLCRLPTGIWHPRRSRFIVQTAKQSSQFFAVCPSFCRTRRNLSVSHPRIPATRLAPSSKKSRDDRRMSRSPSPVLPPRSIPAASMVR